MSILQHKLCRLLTGIIASMLLIPSCSEDKSEFKRDVDPRYIEAQKISNDWCLRTQIKLSGLNEDATNYITVNSFDTYQGLMTGHPSFDASSDSPVVIMSYLSTMKNFTSHTAPETMTKEAMCKFIGVENLTDNFSEHLMENATDTACKIMNEEALDWALEQLTQEEIDRYNTEGKKLTFKDDTVAIGSAWYHTCSEFDASGDNYILSSASQTMPYTSPQNGSHYCKLMTPEQALYWVLDRAFWDDPLASGSKKDKDSSFICDFTVPENDCMLQILETDFFGSCIYYSDTALIKMCIDYTGSKFDGTGAETNCNGRTPLDKNTGDPIFQSRYSTLPCSMRDDLFNDTGFKDFRGICVLSCGDEENEYRMNVYNDAYNPSTDEIMPPTAYCNAPGIIWYPAPE